MALDTECFYAEHQLCRMSFMLSVTNKLFMPSVIVLNVVAPSFLGDGKVFEIVPSSKLRVFNDFIKFDPNFKL